jgi:hypothetical protein
MRQTLKRQRVIPGQHRIPTLGCLDPKLRQWVEREAYRFGCFPSHVMNTLVSHVSGIPLECERYNELPKAKMLKARILRMKRRAS